MFNSTRRDLAGHEGNVGVARPGRRERVLGRDESHVVGWQRGPDAIAQVSRAKAEEGALASTDPNGATRFAQCFDDRVTIETKEVASPRAVSRDRPRGWFRSGAGAVRAVPSAGEENHIRRGEFDERDRGEVENERLVPVADPVEHGRDDRRSAKEECTGQAIDHYVAVDDGGRVVGSARAGGVGLVGRHMRRAGLDGRRLRQAMENDDRTDGAPDDDPLR